MNTRVIAVNLTLSFIEVFDTAQEAVLRCPGLEIAEGDWLFFAGNGSPLKAVFSKPPYVDEERNVYGDGVYILSAGKGPSLQDWLFDFCKTRNDFRFGTSEQMEALFS